MHVMLLSTLRLTMRLTKAKVLARLLLLEGTMLLLLLPFILTRNDRWGLLHAASLARILQSVETRCVCLFILAPASALTKGRDGHVEQDCGKHEQCAGAADKHNDSGGLHGEA